MLWLRFAVNRASVGDDYALRDYAFYVSAYHLVVVTCSGFDVKGQTPRKGNWVSGLRPGDWSPGVAELGLPSITTGEARRCHVEPPNIQ